MAKKIILVASDESYNPDKARELAKFLRRETGHKYTVVYTEVEAIARINSPSYHGLITIADEIPPENNHPKSLNSLLRVLKHARVKRLPILAIVKNHNLDTNEGPANFPNYVFRLLEETTTSDMPYEILTKPCIATDDSLQKGKPGYISAIKKLFG